MNLFRGEVDSYAYVAAPLSAMISQTLTALRNLWTRSQ